MKKTLVITIVLSLLLVGCATKNPAEVVFVEGKGEFETKVARDVPNWLNEISDENYIYNYGTSQHADIRAALGDAELNAKGRLADSIGVMIQTSAQSAIKAMSTGGQSEAANQFVEELKSTAEQYVVGARVTKTYFASDGVTYIQVGVAKNNIIGQMSSAIDELSGSGDSAVISEEEKSAMKESLLSQMTI
jgi:major membrane immunogen (membrane-anchored lipoprotein)